VSLLSLGLVFSLIFPICAFSDETIYRGDGLTRVSLNDALQDVQHGDILILGEIHGQMKVADYQMQVLETLKYNGLSVSIGMEFFDYTDQYFVDKYRFRELSEEEFLYQVKWGQGFPFSAYKRQIHFPKACGLTTLALNAPRQITSKIAKNGLNSLQENERNLLPTDFTLGNSAYFERFKSEMGGHVPAEKIENYFAAQSAWDDTMAWRASSHLLAHPDQVLVIIVGEFHSQYGGGLPDRLKARGVEKVHTLSFVNTSGLNQQERDFQILPSPKYGERANIIWELDLNLSFQTQVHSF